MVTYITIRFKKSSLYTLLRLSGTQLLTNSIAYSSKSHGGGGADTYREQTQTNKYTRIHFFVSSFLYYCFPTTCLADCQRFSVCRPNLLSNRVWFYKRSSPTVRPFYQLGCMVYSYCGCVLFSYRENIANFFLQIILLYVPIGRSVGA